MNDKLRVILFLFFALILNLIWEFSHYSLYYDYSSIIGIPHLFLAGFGDLFLIGFIFFIISAKRNSIKWVKKPVISDYGFLMVAGFLISIIIEIINIKFLGRWAYKPQMPVIFGIGLSPMLQLTITSIMSLEICRRFN